MIISEQFYHIAPSNFEKKPFILKLLNFDFSFIISCHFKAISLTTSLSKRNIKAKVFLTCCYLYFITKKISKLSKPLLVTISFERILKKKKIIQFKGNDICKLSPLLYNNYLSIGQFYNSLKCKKNKDFANEHSFLSLRKEATAFYVVFPNKKIIIRKKDCAFNYPKWFNIENDFFLQNSLLQELFFEVVTQLPGYDPLKKYFLQVLFTKHDVSTPLLRVHRDGINGWLIHFNIFYSKENISGGNYLIYDKNKNLLFEDEGKPSFLDGYILKDSLFFHSATNITVKNNENAERCLFICRVRWNKNPPLEFNLMI